MLWAWWQTAGIHVSAVLLQGNQLSGNMVRALQSFAVLYKNLLLIATVYGNEQNLGTNIPRRSVGYCYVMLCYQVTDAAQCHPEFLVQTFLTRVTVSKSAEQCSNITLHNTLKVHTLPRGTVRCSPSNSFETIYNVHTHILLCH